MVFLYKNLNLPQSHKGCKEIIDKMQLIIRFIPNVVCTIKVDSAQNEVYLVFCKVLLLRSLSEMQANYQI